MPKRFIKSEDGKKIAERLGFNPQPGVKDTWIEQEGEYVRLYKPDIGWIVETEISRTALKKAGLITSAVDRFV